MNQSAKSPHKDHLCRHKEKPRQQREKSIDKFPACTYSWWRKNWVHARIFSLLRREWEKKPQLHIDIENAANNDELVRAVFFLFFFIDCVIRLSCLHTRRRASSHRQSERKSIQSKLIYIFLKKTAVKWKCKLLTNENFLVNLSHFPISTKLLSCWRNQCDWFDKS